MTTTQQLPQILRVALAMTFVSAFLTFIVWTILNIIVRGQMIVWGNWFRRFSAPTRAKTIIQILIWIIVVTGIHVLALYLLYPSNIPLLSFTLLIGPALTLTEWYELWRPSPPQVRRKGARER